MLMFTAIADIKPSAAFPVALVAAPCANKAVGPSQREKIGPAGLLCDKARIKGGLVCRKILGHLKLVHFRSPPIRCFWEPVYAEAATDAVTPAEKLDHLSEVHNQIKL
jgi:hypothetical protein